MRYLSLALFGALSVWIGGAFFDLTLHEVVTRAYWLSAGVFMCWFEDYLTRRSA